MVFEGFFLGLSTGMYCVLTCSPLMIPLLASKKRGIKATAGILGTFLAGRLAAYLAAGAILGLVGTYALGYVSPPVQRILGGASFLLAGLVMLAQGLQLGGSKAWFCRASAKMKAGGNAAIFGFASGFSLCPPFVAAAARVFGAGGAIGGGIAGAEAGAGESAGAAALAPGLAGLAGAGTAGAGSLAPGMTGLASSSDLALGNMVGGLGYFGLFFLGTALFFLPLLGFGFLRKIPVRLALVARVVMVMLGVYFAVILGMFRLVGVV